MESDVFQVEIDTLNASEWDAVLARFSDASIYQTSAYAGVRWGDQNVSRLVLKRAGSPVALAQLRIVQPTPFRVGVAYLRWGPMVHRTDLPLESEVVNRMATALEDEYVKKRGLFLRILPAGFKDTARAELFKKGFGGFNEEQFKPGESYRTMVVDLSPPLDQIRKRLDQKWRNQLNRAEKNNLTIQTGDADGEFDVMVQLFNEMWDRKQFKKSSDISEFKKIQNSLPTPLRMRLFICLHAGIPVSGLIGTAIGQTGIYLFGATSNAGMEHKGSYLLQWEMIKWQKSRGITSYNLGGINPETNPGVYHFKKGLSGEDVLYLPRITACTNPLSRTFATTGMTLAKRMQGAVSRVLASR